MTTYEVYPGAAPARAVHGVVVTQHMANGSRSEILGPFTEEAALRALAIFATRGSRLVDVTGSLVMRVSDREVVVVHDTFLSTWTARAVVAATVSSPED